MKDERNLNKFPNETSVAVPFRRRLDSLDYWDRTGMKCSRLENYCSTTESALCYAVGNMNGTDSRLQLPTGCRFWFVRFENWSGRGVGEHSGGPASSPVLVESEIGPAGQFSSARLPGRRATGLECA